MSLSVKHAVKCGLQVASKIGSLGPLGFRVLLWEGGTKMQNLDCDALTNSQLGSLLVIYLLDWTHGIGNLMKFFQIYTEVLKLMFLLILCMMML